MRPKALSLIAASAVFASTYSISNVFPYAAFMVVHFTGVSKEEAGSLAGVFGASFMLSRVPASFVWGFATDNIGRKPVLLIGCFSQAAFQLLLGFAPSFEVAVALRFVTGLFSGVIGAAKTISSELASQQPKDQALAMNTITLASNVGVVMGPAISGLLYDPASQYPGSWLAGLPFVEAYPFLLPNLASACFSLLSGIAILLFLPETLPSPVPISTFLCRRAPAHGSAYAQVHVSEVDNLEYECGRQGGHDAGDSVRHGGCDGGGDGGGDVGGNGDVPGASEPAAPPPPASLPAAAKCRIADSERPAPHENTGVSGSGFAQFVGSIRAVWANPKVPQACLTYSFYGLSATVYGEVHPLWLLSSPAVGGFGYDAKRIGATISASAVLLLGFQVFVYPLVAGFRRPIRYAQLSLMALIAYFAMLPAVGYVGLLDLDAGAGPAGPAHDSGSESHGSIAVMAVLIGVHAAYNILNVLFVTQTNVMANNSCYVHERGTVNGIMMGVGSIFKAVGPVLGGSLFAWSVNSTLPKPLNYGLCFLVVAALNTVLLAFTRSLPVALNHFHGDGDSQKAVDVELAPLPPALSPSRAKPATTTAA